MYAYSSRGKKESDAASNDRRNANGSPSYHCYFIPAHWISIDNGVSLVTEMLTGLDGLLERRVSNPTLYTTEDIKHLPTSHLTTLTPLLIGLLEPSVSDETIFVAVSDTLQDLLTRSALSDGSGSKTLTEPLLVWFDVVGSRITETSLGSEDNLSIVHSLCKLLVALGDHSTPYFATYIASSMPVSTGPITPPTSKGHLVQSFMRQLLIYTGLPGYYGVDEEESEMTLGFWYLFQEALWTTDFYIEEGGDDRSPAPPDVGPSGESKQVLMAKAVYIELVKVLRRKVSFPPQGSGWGRGGKRVVP